MQARSVLRAEVGNLVDRVEAAETRRAERRHDRANTAGAQSCLECSEVELPAGGLWQRLVSRANHLGDAGMRVVRVRR